MTLEERLAIIEQKANNNKVKTKENETIGTNIKFAKIPRHENFPK